MNDVTIPPVSNDVSRSMEMVPDNPFVTCGLSAIKWSFIINKLYFNDLLNDAYPFSAANRTSYDEVASYAGGRVPRLDKARMAQDELR